MEQLPQYQQAFVEQYGYLLWLLVPLILLDLVLKGWSMWRAARMDKMGWFIALLVVNSAGILPAIFLLMTKKEYAKTGKGR